MVCRCFVRLAAQTVVAVRLDTPDLTMCRAVRTTEAAAAHANGQDSDPARMTRHAPRHFTSAPQVALTSFTVSLWNDPLGHSELPTPPRLGNAPITPKDVDGSLADSGACTRVCCGAGAPTNGPDA
jgi:hypothetical protein